MKFKNISDFKAMPRLEGVVSTLLQKRRDALKKAIF